MHVPWLRALRTFGRGRVGFEALEGDEDERECGCEDAEELASRLQEVGKKGIRCERMMECEHAWEKNPCKEGTMQHREKERAYSLAVETLKKSLEV